MPSRLARYAERSCDGLLGEVPDWLWTSALAAAALGLVTPNPALTATAVLLVPLGYGLLWHDGQPPALLFVFGIQWLQVTVPVFEADFAGSELADIGPVPSVETAAWLCMVGLLVFAMGARAALPASLRSPVASAEARARGFSPPRLFWAWAALLFLSAVISKLMFLVPGLTQLLGALRTLKWVAVFLLGYSVLLRRSDYGWFLAMIVIEVLYGFTQYFSGFRAVFSLLCVLLLTGRSLAKERMVGLGVAASVLAAMTLFWTSVKPQYRDFLNAGSGQQEAVAPVWDRLKKLSQLLGEFGRNDLGEAAQGLSRRIGYLDYFAHSIEFVPSTVPHQRGRLWGEALWRPLTPRLLFPDKAPAHDSLRTREYTGINVAGPDEGTSIGIGYMGESYIDFGKFGMCVPIFFWGLMCGWIYRIFVFRLADKAFGFAAATSILVFGASQLEVSNIKLVGGNLTTVIVMLGCYFFLWQHLRRFLVPTEASDLMIRKRTNRGDRRSFHSRSAV